MNPMSKTTAPFSDFRRRQQNFDFTSRRNIFEHRQRHMDGAFGRHREIAHDPAAARQHQINHFRSRITRAEIDGLGALVGGHAVDHGGEKAWGLSNPWPCHANKPCMNAGFSNTWFLSRYVRRRL